MISGVADGGALAADGAGEDQRLQPRARQLGQAHRQHAVEPGRSLVACDGDVQPLPLFDAFCSKEEPILKDCMTETVAPEPTPEQAALFARVRRMMLIAGLTTALAVAAVLIAIGYRLFRTEGSAVASRPARRALAGRKNHQKTRRPGRPPPRPGVRNPNRPPDSL